MTSFVKNSFTLAEGANGTTSTTPRGHEVQDHRRSRDAISSQSQLSYTRRTRRKNATNRAKFPKQLFQILEEAEERDEKDIISFLPHGMTFTIRNVARFVEEVMPRYFRSCRYQTFVRQLNLYGFRRVSEPDGSFAYYHEHFRRDKKRQSQRIMRRGRLPEEEIDRPVLLAEADTSRHNQPRRTKNSTLQDEGRGNPNYSPGRGTDNSRRGIGQQALLHLRNDGGGRCQPTGPGTAGNRERLNALMAQRLHQLDSAAGRFLLSSVPRRRRGGSGGRDFHDNLNAARTGLRGGSLLDQELLASATASSNDPLDLVLGPLSESPTFFPSTLPRRSVFGLSHDAKAAIIASSRMTSSALTLKRRRLLLEQNAIEQERRARLVAALSE